MITAAILDFMPELPWSKWYMSDWASEPGLRACRPSTRGIWFEALNTMMLTGDYQLSGCESDLCSLLSCLPAEFRMAIDQLKIRNVAEIDEQNGNIIIVSRKRKRDYELKQLRAKAGRASGTSRRTKHRTQPQHGVGTKGGTPSASASASASVSSSFDGGEGGSFEPTFDHAKKWLSDWKRSGADYSESETRTAFLALSANGWMWGKNPVTNFQAALERQIQTDRQRTNHGQHSKPNQQSVDRSIGTANEGVASQYGDFADRQRAKMGNMAQP
jgi:hypothetical protein